MSAELVYRVSVLALNVGKLPQDEMRKVLIFSVKRFGFVSRIQVFYLHVSASCACSACSEHRDQKRTLGSLELKLQTVMSHLVGAVKQTQFLC